LSFGNRIITVDCGKLCGIVENFVKIYIDIVVFVVYNRSILNKKGVKMTPEEELKKLEEEHKKAMEAIEAFNKEAKSAIEMGKKNLGV
jgi:hypothetical protein